MKKQKNLPRGRVRAKTHARAKGKKPILTEEKTLVGTFSGTRRGFGFVTPEDNAPGEDVFIPKNETHGALHGDLVRIRYRKKYPTGIEGRVCEVIEKQAKTVVGTLVGERVRGTRSYRKRYFLYPDSTHFPECLPLGERPDAAEGDKIECRIERIHGGIALSFLRSFGAAASFGANRASLLSETGITVDFEAEALREAATVAARPLSHEGRKVQSGPILTIDGADAKDLDDAVSLKRTEEGYLLSVHIADVSEYVTPKTALDRAAMSRGTSVYFADAVVPMLPPALSNGACSLNAGEEKYTLSAHILLDGRGGIIKTELERGIIKSCVRGVYSEVNDLFAYKEQSVCREKYSSVYNMLFLMRELYEILAARAASRGYLDFDAPEPYFVLDENGHPEKVLRRTRGIAERLIEQFMLSANEGVASLLSQKGCPCVYRIHEEPPADKLAFFKKYVYLLGIDPAPLSALPLTTRAFAAVFEEALQKGKASALSIPMLRTMSKALYSDERADHFGLGLSHYCHFTSPIRRLSDLATHRIIKAVLLDGEDKRKYVAYARRAAAAASESELRALAAERAMNALYAALWAQGHIGEEMEAEISGITAFGVFAMLDNTVEGLIPLDTLPFGSLTDEDNLLARIDGEGYRLADRIRVTVSDVELSARRVRFAFLSRASVEESGIADKA